jgi:AraC family transcriptional regulator
MDAFETRDWVSPQYKVDVNLSGTYELQWKRKGSYRRTRMPQEALCILPAHQPLSMSWNVRIEILSVSLEPLLLQHTAHDLGLRGTFEIGEHHTEPDTQISHICHALQAEQQTGYPAGCIFGESLATALAACLLQRYATRPSTPTGAGNLSPRRWKKVRDFIEDNLEHNISLEDLACIAGLSPYHFSRCFKASTGTSPHQYIITRRVERARQLLSQKKLPLSQIAAQCGFADQSHLTRHIKRHLGVTPAALLPLQ